MVGIPILEIVYLIYSFVEHEGIYGSPSDKKINLKSLKLWGVSEICTATLLSFICCTCLSRRTWSSEIFTAAFCGICTEILQKNDFAVFTLITGRIRPRTTILANLNDWILSQCWIAATYKWKIRSRKKDNLNKMHSIRNDFL